jgi:vacuolar-type H+-ATPase subunit I/STV1
MDFAKGALLFVALAFQLDSLSIAFDGYYVTVGGAGDGTEFEDRDNAIKAFLIIGYLCFLAAFLLQLLQNFAGLKGSKLVSIIVIILLLGGVVCILIGIIIFGDTVGSDYVPAFSMTTYVVSAACGTVAALLMLLSMCCGCGGK